MQVVDLTHFLSQGMPVYPGTEGPRFESANTYERDGFQETRMTMYTHTGTHVDPPAHLFPGGATLDRLPITQFVGTALVIDCTDLREGGRIAMDRVERRRADADMAEFLLFRTGWDRYWGDPRYFGDYPCIDQGIVDYLLQSGKKGVGLDTIGVDPIADAYLSIHRRLFQDHDLVVMENLANLDQIGDGLFTLFALPLRYQDADGSPIRAVAVLDGEE